VQSELLQHEPVGTQEAPHGLQSGEQTRLFAAQLRPETPPPPQESATDSRLEAQERIRSSEIIIRRTAVLGNRGPVRRAS
jgi:hypothetical protein